MLLIGDLLLCKDGLYPPVAICLQLPCNGESASIHRFENRLDGTVAVRPLRPARRHSSTPALRSTSRGDRRVARRRRSASRPRPPAAAGGLGRAPAPCACPCCSKANVSCPRWST